MKNKWTDILKYDPIETLKKIDDSLIQYHLQKYLLKKNTGSPHTLWKHKIATSILKNQQKNGSWPDKKRKAHKNIQTDYELLETYRYMAQLFEFFKFDNSHPSIQKAAKFIFSTQTEEGDFRGIYGNQYSPNYSSAILELLCKVGYLEDEHIHRSFEWLLSIEQDEGGWILPMEMPQVKRRAIELYNEEAINPDTSLPFSHWVTGIIIRAFAHHPRYRNHPSALRAGELLASRFFQRDKYSSRSAPDYWTKYSYPFWWTDLISVLDALSVMNFSATNKDIKHALNHFCNNQKKDGSWDPYILKSKSFPNLKWWINYRICLIFKNFYNL